MHTFIYKNKLPEQIIPWLCYLQNRSSNEGRIDLNDIISFSIKLDGEYCDLIGISDIKIFCKIRVKVVDNFFP